MSMMLGDMVPGLMNSPNETGSLGLVAVEVN